MSLHRLSHCFALAVALCLPLVPALAQQAGANPMQGLKTTKPLEARLWSSDSRDRDVALIGIGKDKLAYANRDKPAVVQGVIALDSVQRAQFELEIDYAELAKAEGRRDWVGVYRVLNAALAPAMPYLTLPDNNAADRVMQMAGAMMRIAARGEREGISDEDRERVAKQYEAAYGVFKQLAEVNWSPIGTLSVIKGSQCLLKIGKPKTAQYYLDEMPEPMPGDVSYGSYWLTQGQLAILRGEIRKALEYSILSVAFEDKDIESFPDALMLSANCYEQQEEWYRARDIYFEVASLFPNTDWADDAAGRLDTILKSGKTVDAEESVIENVFFAVNEDINDLGRKLLEERARAQSTSTEEPGRRRPPVE